MFNGDKEKGGMKVGNSWRERKGDEYQTLSKAHTNARKAYMYAFALLAGVGDLSSMASRISLCEVGR